MKIEKTKRIDIKEIIDIEFPYFYEHDLMSDYGESVIYGKILQDIKYKSVKFFQIPEFKFISIN